MAYGKIKADTLVYDNSGSDVEVTLSSIGSKANLPASAGTVAASEVVQVDANKDITGFRNITLAGDLTVNGTTTTIDSTTLTVEDKNIELGKVSTPTDTTADGGGITLKGATDKTITWVDSTDNWTFNQNIEITGTAPRLIFTDSNNDSDFRINVDGGSFQIQDTTNSSATRVAVDSSGRMIIGADSAITTFTNRLIQVAGDANGAGVIALGRDHSTLTSQGLGGIEFYGNDPGAAYTRTAGIYCNAAAEWTSNDYPSELTFKTTPDGSATNTTALTLDSSQNATFVGHVSLNDNKVVQFGDDNDFFLKHDNTNAKIQNGTGELQIVNTANSPLKLYTNNNVRLTIAHNGHITTSNSISDDKGNLRSIPQKTGSTGTATYELVAADAGKHVYHASTGSITVPPTSGIFSAGDAITILNGHASGTFQILQGTGVTIWNSGDGTSGTRTVGVKGMCTLLCVGSNGYYISGAGLT